MKQETKSFKYGDKVKDLSGFEGTVIPNPHGIAGKVRVAFGEDGKSIWRDLNAHQLTLSKEEISNGSIGSEEGFTGGNWYIEQKHAGCAIWANIPYKEYDRVIVASLWALNQQANAALICEAKNIYHELKDILLYTKVKNGRAEWKTSAEKIDQLKAIINRINKH